MSELNENNEMNEEDFSVFDPAEFCGWAGSDKKILKAALDKAPSKDKKPFKIIGDNYWMGPKRMMLWEVVRKVLGKDTPNYAQEIGDCGVAGTQVLMDNGLTKNIEDVRIGDFVITHKNRSRRVLRTIQKKYTGNLVTTKVKNYHKYITMTEDHEFITYQNDPYQYTWKHIDSLKKEKDFLLLPYGIQSNEFQYIEYDNKKILVDEKFARIIGLYLAKGGVTSKLAKDNDHEFCNKVTFNLGSDEDWLANDIITLLQDVFDVQGVKYYHKMHQNVILVEVHNSYFSTFLKNLIPGNVYTKSVPGIILRSPRIVKKSLLKGWLDGDGHVANDRRVSGATSSKNMFDSMYRLAISCGYWPKTKFVKQQPHQNVSPGIMSFSTKDSADILNIQCGYDRHNLRDCVFGNISEVITLDREFVKDIDVYCIEVEEDHSFIANGYAVKNCTSFGGKNALEYLQAFQIAMGATFDWKPVFPPYIYGCERVFIGDGGRGGDGGLGVWVANAVKKYGVLFSDTDGCPKYSGSVARKWGSPPGPPKNFISVGQHYLVKTINIIKTVDEALNALLNGYPVTLASDVGFDMKQRSDGFMHYSTSWPHEMCLIGGDAGDANVPENYCILNSWGDAHGAIKDFRTGENWPVGTLRVNRKDLQAILNDGDSWAFSDMDGFPAKILPESFFSIF